MVQMVASLANSPNKETISCAFCLIAKIGRFTNFLKYSHISHICYDIINILDAISLTNQSIPSTSPCPVIAEHENIDQCRPLIASSSNCRSFEISSTDSAPPRSCLFANISKLAPASFYTQLKIYRVTHNLLA